ncbi:hypothetical protein F511_10576 [Dorcoceras hygrometricum]|uniref:DCD domain-containing protein n=1 Tax=Dorcoceras hygrometricum TaxID=472368 RepID=A0A2Z7CHD9_9LAMI|nr:hypothetical protein F511_10576 [Dorcoceras hygrometricum]
MNATSFVKKPKIELEAEEEEQEREGAEEEQNRKEREEALLALIQHRTKEVEHIRQRITYYQSQLDEAEKRLEDTQTKLAHHHGQDISMASKASGNVTKEPQSKPQTSGLDTKKSSEDNLNVSQKPASPFHQNGESCRSQIQSKSLLIRPVNLKMEESGNKANDGYGSLPSSSLSTYNNSTVKQKGDKARKLSSVQEAMHSEPKGKKAKLEEKEHRDLIPLINSCSSSTMIRCQTGSLLSSQHKRKLRSLVLCPTNDQLFVTSALDGLVNLWQIQGRGSSANLLSTAECQSNKQRRWPEDIAWHPQGNRLFSVYAADGGDSQISILNLNKGREGTRVSFLEDKPHIKGIINSIIFMPWDETRFVTGGSDHAVVLWTEQDTGGSWKPKSLHRSIHSAAVMGVAGMRHKKMVMSVGADKRIIGFDVTSGRADYKHQIESKCMSIVTNPSDFNLFMVQSGTPERQLKLFDLRIRQMEIHAFGWKQESSDSQSALINQAWSPDGLYITSGSADPAIHIFDIRYNSHKPSQSIRAHQKRVFKAVWHHALPLLISISSDLNIGLHKIFSLPMARRGRKSKRNGKSIGQPSAKIKKSNVPKIKPTDGIFPMAARLANSLEATSSNSAFDRKTGVSLRKERKTERLSGFVFMCSSSTKSDCYQYRVFGLPRGKMAAVEKIKPGAKLFLFDFELKLLYGIYEATSAGQLNLEPAAFGGKFPVQVKFRIFEECLPLPESSLRHVIRENYRGSKFNQELNGHQVSNLLSSFQPLSTSPSHLAPPTLSNKSMSLAMPRAATDVQFKYTSQLPALENQYLAVKQYGHAPPLVQPQICTNVSFPRHVGQRTAAYVSHIQPNSDHQGLLVSSNYYVANDQQPYIPERITHQSEYLYPRYRTVHHVQGSSISHVEVTSLGREHHQLSLQSRVPYQDTARSSYVSTLMQPQVSVPDTLQGSSFRSSDYHTRARWVSR